MPALSYDVNQIVEFLNSLGSQEINLEHYDFIDPFFWVALKALILVPMHEMEISVADYGLGFLETIKRRYNDVSSHEEAIRKAILMGLYVISRIVREVSGDMIIVSGDAVFFLKDNLVRKIEIPWQGSILSKLWGLFQKSNRPSDKVKKIKPNNQHIALKLEPSFCFIDPKYPV